MLNVAEFIELDLQQLQQIAEKFDVPVHSNAKEAGTISAIRKFKPEISNVELRKAIKIALGDKPAEDVIKDSSETLQQSIEENVGVSEGGKEKPEKRSTEHITNPTISEIDDKIDLFIRFCEETKDLDKYMQLVKYFQEAEIKSKYLEFKRKITPKAIPMTLRQLRKINQAAWDRSKE